MRSLFIYIGCMFLSFLGSYARAQFEVELPEDFNSLSTPQRTNADIYYGGDLIGSADIIYTPSTVEFVHPERVVDLIPFVIKRAKVLEVLSKKLSTNRQFLCESANAQGDCGKIIPEVADIIFDEARFKIEIFISSDYLQIQKNLGPKYLGLPSEELSMVFNVQGSAQREIHKESDYNFNINTSVAAGRSRVRNLTRYSDRNRNKVYLDELVIEQDQQKWRTSVGLLNSQQNILIPQQEFFGLRLATILDTRVDLELSSGSTIALFLSRKSQVTAFRQNLLLGSFLLPAGNQILNTQDFPQGAYEVTLKIDEVGGASREEKRFFIKASQMPPKDSPQYYLEVGRLEDPRALEDEVNLTSLTIMSIGTSRRIGDSVGFQLGATTGSGRSYATTGLSWISSFWQPAFYIMSSTRNDISFLASSSLNWNQVFFNCSYSKVIPNQSTTVFSRPGVYITSTDKYTQSNATLGLSNSWGKVTIKGNYFKNDTGIETYNYGPRLEASVFQNALWRSTLSFEGIQTETRERIGVMNWDLDFHRSQGFSGKISAGEFYRKKQIPVEEQHTRPMSQELIRWRRDRENEQIQAEAIANYQEGLNTYDSLVRWDNSLGHLDGFGNISESTPVSKRFGGNFLVNMASAGKEWGVGDFLQGRSAMVVDITGSAQNVPFILMVNNQSRGTVRVGERKLIMLAPYEAYSVTIMPADDTITLYASNPQRISVYPGNVSYLQWKVEKKYILITRIYDANKKPIPYMEVEGTLGVAATDSQGFLQAEIVGSTNKLTVLLDNGKKCILEFKKRPPDQEIWRIPGLICRSYSE